MPDRNKTVIDWPGRARVTVGDADEWVIPDIRPVGDIVAARWFVEGLDASLDTVAAVLPGGFEAYARIVNPAWRVRRAGRKLVRTAVRWDEVARLRGTVAHRRMQWRQVWALPVFDDSVIEACADAGMAPIEQLHEGRFPPEVANPLHEVLAAHTQAPDACWFGVWSGFRSEYKGGGSRDGVPVGPLPGVGPVQGSA